MIILDSNQLGQTAPPDGLLLTLLRMSPAEPSLTALVECQADLLTNAGGCFLDYRVEEVKVIRRSAWRWRHGQLNRWQA